MSDEGTRPLGVEEAAARAGVSVDTIRRAYRAGRLRAYRPAGQRRVVIRVEDLDAWAFSDDTLVTPAAGSRLRPADDADTPPRWPARRSSHRLAAPGSVERLRDLERRGG